jgi:hypothetical protein
MAAARRNPDVFGRLSRNNNMQTSVIARCLMLAGLSFAASVAQAAEPVGQTKAGRFQLIQGEYRLITSRGEEFKRKELMKIDSLTGEVFVCMMSQIDGKARGKPGKIIEKAACEPFEREQTFDTHADSRN